MIALPGFVGLTVAGAEIAGNNYTRQAVTFVNGINSTTVAWQIATPGGWGTIDGVQLYDEAGTLLSIAAPTQSVTVLAYQAVRIRAGAMHLSRRPIGWPYGTRRYGTGRYARLDGVALAVDLVELSWAVSDPWTAGAWQPSEPCQAAAWEPVDMCKPGTWNPAQNPLRRAA